MTTNLMTYVDKGNFVDLFQELGWDLPPSSISPLTVDTDAGRFTVCPVADQSGLRVWVCTADTLPDASSQRAIDAEVSKHSQVRLLIFTDGVHQSWRWPRRGATAATNSKLLHHAYTVGNLEQREDLARRLAKIELPLDEHIGITEIQDRMAQAFNDEAVKRSTEASRHMERMNQILLDAGCSTDTASSLLVRLLFLFFGDDTQMWPEDAFQKWVLNHTTADNLHAKLTELFTVLCDEELDKAQTSGGMGQAEGKYAGTEYQFFRRIDGMYQEQVTLPPLPEDFRQQVLTAGEFDWGKVNPDIFGAMFQILVDPEELREKGEHYTSEENIQKVIEPLFLDEYRQRFQDAYDDREKLLALQDELAGLQFMDPACGCGNFLIQAYKHLRGLEYELIQRAEELELEEIQVKLNKPNVRDKRKLIARRDELQAGASLQFDEQILRKSKLSMRQFYGIEINAWPAKVAATAMLLVDHLSNQAWGENVVRLPIEETPQIVHANALRTDWELVVPRNGSSTYVFGNPPFLGHKERTKEQTADLKNVWNTKTPGHLDYVTGWFIKAVHYLRDKKGEFAFVSTSSIVQGESVSRVFEEIFDAGWKISFAYTPFIWDSQASGKAKVHVVIIGFTKDHSRDAILHTEENGALTTEKTRILSPYLKTGIPPLTVKPVKGKPLSPSLRPVRAGSTPIDWDHLVVTKEQYPEVAGDPIASKYLRLYLGGEELINKEKRWCLWMAGEDFDPEDLSKSAILRERIAVVQEIRASRTRVATKKLAETPHLFGEIRQPNGGYLALPQSFSHSRRFATAAHLDGNIIASIKLFTVQDDDLLMFSLASSSMFISWQKTVGGRIRHDPSMSSSMVWNTFPVPILDDKCQQSIIAGGKNILDARALYPERSLADHYNPLTMSPDLLSAHRALDKAVDAAFGVTRPLKSEKDRLEVLFNYYAEITC